MKTYYMKQGSKEWHDIRKMKFTASNANAIIANGKGLSSLVDEMLLKHYSSEAFEEFTGNFKNPHMQRGNDYEDKARMIYELETSHTVEQVGFIELDNYIGISPDGLVGKKGLVEIKCLSDKVFFQLLIDKKIDQKHLDQMQMQMFVSERDWCDYFAFNPNFDPCYIKIRVKKDIEVHKKLVDGLTNGKKILIERKAKYDKLLKLEAA